MPGAAKTILTEPGEADELPAMPGAYGLVIQLKRPIRLAIPALDGERLAPGCYLYVGSANGPGGIGARVRRHLRRGKKQHWHVDRLTARGRVTAVLTVAGGDECRLGARALRVQGVTVPVAGFGSSDCTDCAAHLMALPGDGRAVVKKLVG